MTLAAFRRRAGTPVAVATVAAFLMTLSPARMARAAGTKEENGPPPEMIVTNEPIAPSPTADPEATEQRVVPDDVPRNTATPQTTTSTTDDQTETPVTGEPSRSSMPQAAAAAVPAVEPAALPTGADKSGVTSKAISVPKGSGSIQGMEESFSAQLSTGIATFSVPFALPAARGGAQPSLGLSYSSSGGYGVAGVGWQVGVPFIARQTDRGVPRYEDNAAFPQDRFVFNGGQELVPICTVVSGTCAGAQPDEAFPTWADGQQYFRPRVEGSFLRFFWSANHQTWRVQDKSGVTMELGVPLGGPSGNANGIEVNPDKPSEIFRWHLVRQYDTYAANVVEYRFLQDGGSAYLSDIYDTPPVATAASAPLAEYAHHTHLVYETRTDPTSSWRSGWKMEQKLRLSRVEVASKAFSVATTTARHQVRRYRLSYDPAYHASLLASVQVEGRCDGDEGDAPAESNGLLPASSGCPTLPPMKFEYTHVTPFKTDGSAGLADLPGYEGFDERVTSISGSPPHSVDEELTDLFDIDSDGLPDVLVTAPGEFNGGHGVYFNSAGGTPSSFGAAETMLVDGVLGANASSITLKNLNLAALDLDGDATIDLLHMPKVKTYSVYTPARVGTQWHWVGRTVDTASQQNPKIDFGKDTLDVQVMDVDFDGLVDVVFSTGTEMQTFFSLGRFPGGDGQFGHATRTGATTATLSNDPVTSCVPWSSTPIRFSDPDIKLADMNGDGITDIVRIRQGDVRYWPGRGNGFWGTGKRDDCPGGTFGQGRDIQMATSPQYSDPNGSGLRLDDVNGDGLADLVQVRFTDVDVWLNVDGKSWTDRHVITDTPADPSYADRVRLVDVNGSSTRDLLWGDGNKFKYIDLQGGEQSALLVHVDNGLGKTTDLEYSTSTAEMLAAEQLGACKGTQPDPDPWSHGWCKKMPTVTQVVKRVTESDNLTVAGRPPGTYVTEYSYRDPVFEGRQREFRGFSRAKSKRIGDDNSPTDITESTFLLGECKDETADGQPDCSTAFRWKDNPREALKGLPLVTERYDESATYLSTEHTTYTLRTLYHGLDGRIVAHAFESAKDTYLYDTAAGTATGGSTPDADDVVRDFDDGNTPGPDTASPVPIRTGSATHLQSESTVDAFGNRLTAVDKGCVSGCAATDEEITTATTPDRPSGDPTGWLWRTVESQVTGNVYSGPARNHTSTTYDAHGNPTDTYAELVGTLALDRFHETSGTTAPAPDGSSADTTGATLHVSEMTYDADTGNLAVEEGPNGRCRVIGFDLDSDYKQLPSVELTETGDSSTGTPTGFGCHDFAHYLYTVAAYDRGFGLATVVIDMQGQTTKVAYDGFGRLTQLFRPLPGSSSPSSVASVKIEYFLPPDLPADSGSTTARHSVIHTMTQDGDAISDDGNYLESWSYVDGFGRNIVGLSEADPTADGHSWIATDLSEYDNKSAVRRKYLADYYDGDPKHFPFSGASSAPYGRQRYDAFGRQLQTFDLDGTVTLQSRYHALSSDHWDAADLEPGPHQGTPATEEKDGHGRTTATIERTHQGGAVESRAVKTTYLPTGEPEKITRTRGTDSVVRWMRYDSLGRMVLNVEPNTTKDFDPDPTADPDSMKAWRYAYDDAGDLVGTSDARGCGANYAYDSAGRLLAEDYSPCQANQPAYSAADLSAGTGIEVGYVYDVTPETILGTGNAPSGFDDASVDADFFKGRLVCVLDRASITLNVFDGRGRVTATGLVLVAQDSQYNDFATRYGGRFYQRRFAFDAADREIGATTGATVTELQGASASDANSTLTSTSLVTTEYTRRGTLKQAGGSYERDSTPHVGNITRTADGLVEEVHYGDLADTATHYSYDNRRRLRSVQTYRGPPSDWSASSGHTSYSPSGDPSGAPDTFQLLLQDTDYTYDVVNNPTEIHDWRNAAEWPAGAKPVTQKVEYDDLYRATRIDYQYAAGDDDWTNPFDQEDTSGPNDPRRAAPSPHVSFDKRVLYQSYQYDWLGNTSTTNDDADGFYDRSLGTVTNDTANDKPYQLRHAAITSGTRDGNLDVRYDDAGNLTRMNVVRNGPCVGGTCSQRFAYDWDEVGRLVEARRWDGASGAVDDALPGTAADAHLKYIYDAGDDRVVKEAIDSEENRVYTLYLFETLELRRASWISDDYDDSADTEVAYLAAHGVTLARLVYEPSGDDVPVISSGYLHVFYELGDHLGSTSVVLDQATGELVERATFEGYGATESDYRPDRWKSFREDRRFTGKEEDVEVGLYYFGKRYLNPLLGRWVSADPLAIHGMRGDANAYAYVSGRLLAGTDPNGLDLRDTLVGIAGYAVERGRQVVQPLLHAQEHTVEAVRAAARGDWASAAKHAEAQIKQNTVDTAKGAVSTAYHAIVDLPRHVSEAVHARDPFEKGRRVAIVQRDVEVDAQTALLVGVGGAELIGRLAGARGGSVSPAKPTARVTVTSEEVGQALADAAQETTSLYHKGELEGGKVDATRKFSTGTDRNSVERLERRGEVHEFRVPNGVLKQWLAEDKATQGWDYDKPTGVTQRTIDIHPPTSGEMNQFKNPNGT